MSSPTQYPPEQRWLFRIEGSGVWLGGTIGGPGPLPGTFMLVNARRAHQWQGAIDCSEIARAGLAASSRVTEATTFGFRLDRVLETHPMSGDALARLDACPVARASK